MAESQTSSVRKAAILLASLDRATAEALLGQMEADEAKRVRFELAGLNSLDPAEQGAVIEEFFRIGPITGPGPAETTLARAELPTDELRLAESDHDSTPVDGGNDDGRPRFVPDRFHPGIELNSDHARDLVRRAAAELHQAPNSPLSFLQEESIESILPMLEGEHPQTIAVVVANLPPEQAAEVISRLTSNTQVDVVHRLVEMGETDPQILSDVAHSIRNWLEQQRWQQDRQALGIRTISSILSAADTATKRQILGNLSKHDRGLASKLATARLHFSDLEQLDNESLVELLTQFDLLVVATAMIGAEASMTRRVKEALPIEAARQLASGIAQLGSVRQVDVEQAQQLLADRAQQLHLDGKLQCVRGSHLTALA